MVSGLYRPCRLIARSLQARVFVYHLMEMCSSAPGIYEPVDESSSKLTILIKNWTKKGINFIFEQAAQLREIGTTFRQSVSKYSCHMIFLSLVAWCKRVNSYPYQKGLYPYIFFFVYQSNRFHLHCYYIAGLVWQCLAQWPFTIFPWINRNVS